MFRGLVNNINTLMLITSAWALIRGGLGRVTELSFYTVFNLSNTSITHTRTHHKGRLEMKGAHTKRAARFTPLYQRIVFIHIGL
ncbi:hypothetical protein EDB19DRAFT_496813 [Suillus lakei]|nr:hypothetical protein EDB19DRAFT_496813 [Suillus lakei]